MFYLRDGVGSPLLAGWFALACLPATLAGGDLIQSSSIAASLEAAFGADRLAVGAAVTLLTALVMLGGLGRIARVSSVLVPAAKAVQVRAAVSTPRTNPSRISFLMLFPPYTNPPYMVIRRTASFITSLRFHRQGPSRRTGP